MKKISGDIVYTYAENFSPRHSLSQLNAYHVMNDLYDKEDCAPQAFAKQGQTDSISNSLVASI